MMTLNEKQKKAIIEQTKTVCEQTSEGKSTREIMAEIYVNNLDDKTYEQGLMMADAIIESVASFDNQYAAAKGDIDSWLDKTLEDIAGDMSPAERCTLWLKIATAVTMANDELKNEGSYNNKGIIKEIENITITPEEATAEVERELFENAKSAIENSNIMLSTVVEQAESLKNAENDEAVAEILLDFGSREIDFRAIASMIAYTNVKNGTFDNIPVDMKLEQLTTAVCATVEELRIAQAVAENKMDLETAKLLLSILGAISVLSIIPSMVNIGTFVISSLLGGIIALPAMGAMTVLMIIGIRKGLAWWDKETAELVEQCAVPIGVVRDGLDRVRHSIKETVLPKISEILSNIKNRVINLINSIRGNVLTETDEVEESEVITEEEFVADMEWVND